jgi:hypothetical protein
MTHLTTPRRLEPSMLVLISDANVLIDLEVGGIIERIFRLGATVAVPDVLFDEELAARHAHLIALGLQVKTLDDAAILRVAEWSVLYPRPSRNDLLAFALAVQESGVLLTGDRDLRTAIQTERKRPDGTMVEIHGTVWLVEQMLIKGALSDAEAKVAIDLMKQDKCRLPWSDFDELMRRRSRRTTG